MRPHFVRSFVALTVLVALAAMAAVTLGSTSTHALPPERACKVVEDARSLLGAPYKLGGRLRAQKSGVEGIDCQGLVFFALQSVAALDAGASSATRATAEASAARTSRCGWKSWSVMPTLSIAAGELGEPVFLDERGDSSRAVATAKLDASRLEPGDVIHFVGFLENPAEKAIGALDGKPVWVWHMALAAGGGRFVASDPFVGRVIEEDLLAHLAEHADIYAGVLVTRMREGPKAATCRSHPPMRAPPTAPLTAPPTASPGAPPTASPGAPPTASPGAPPAR